MNERSPERELTPVAQAPETQAPPTVERPEPRPHEDSREREAELSRLRRELGSREREPSRERTGEVEPGRSQERSRGEHARASGLERPMTRGGARTVEKKVPV